jgi:hypothetical protein
MCACPVITLEEVEDAARRVGCKLKITATGPAYKVELLWDAGASLPAPIVQTLGYQEDRPPPPDLLGYSNGFAQPNGVAHLETIEVRRFNGFWSRKTERGGARYAAARVLSPGILVSCAVCCWLREQSPFKCETAQLLCIRDDDRQHGLLVRYYKQLGFEPVREVGAGIQSVVDRITWGGDGTIMQVNIEKFAEKWAPAVCAIGAGSK